MEFYLVEEFMGEIFTFFHTTIQSRDSTKDATRSTYLEEICSRLFRKCVLLDGVNWSKS